LFRLWHGRFLATRLYAEVRSRRVESADILPSIESMTTGNYDPTQPEQIFAPLHVDRPQRMVTSLRLTSATT
jgi:hypothetical protein